MFNTPALLFVDIGLRNHVGHVLYVYVNIIYLSVECSDQIGFGDLTIQELDGANICG